MSEVGENFCTEISLAKKAGYCFVAVRSSNVICEYAFHEELIPLF